MEQHITVVPDKELVFPRPLTADPIPAQLLSLSNSSTTLAIAFKVKTTAPKQYCVRPNSGVLYPGQSLQVQVLLQPMKEEPPADFVCKDKFLLQFIQVPADIADSMTPATAHSDANAAQLGELWTQTEALKRTVADPQSVLFEKKLRCQFGRDTGVAVSALPSVVASPPPVATTSAEADAPIVITRPASNLERELKESKDKIKSLQTACEVYKSEIERINALRIRKAQESEPSSTSVSKSSSPGKATKSSWLSKLAVVLIAVLSFALGYYFSSQN